ncbi:hypothetical protein IEQ34_021380 [Dendrobium chrysotoxum]|uniref:F-box domain-containing protein n=1 Tax=Dendrobium chrysotoxum TaxID=161865 RepID=A0AAV7G4R0_DENCH|nr:hypothetical protein IEQ34_021380 [Dendrobium chrysotoxum]
MGLEWLIRVPHGTLPLLRRVCRRWKQATESPLFHRLRRSTSSSDHLIIFLQVHPAISAAGRPSLPSYHLATLHQSSGEWAPFPTIPLFPQSLPLFCTLATSDIHLVVVGGWDPETLTCSDAVYVTASSPPPGAAAGPCQAPPVPSSPAQPAQATKYSSPKATTRKGTP